MPKALIPLPSVYHSVVRRVAVRVANYLTELMGLPDTTKVHLPGQIQAVPMDDATFGICCKPNINYPGDSRFVVTFIEEAEEEYALSTSVFDKQNRPIIHDKVRAIEVRPIYRFVKLTCNIEYIATSATQAQRWLDDMRAMFSAGRTENVLDLEYYFQLPEGLIMTLKALHDAMMLSDWPITDTFEEWVIKHITNGAYPKNLTTLGGFHNTLAIAEHQYEVLGWFDWTTTPDTPERVDDGSGAYSVNFSYRINYDRPTHVHITYPMIANQYPIDQKFRHMEPYGFFRDRLRKVSFTKDNFDEFRFLQDNIGQVPYAQYPNTDDWYHPFVEQYNKELIFFTGLVMLSKDDTQTLMDLTDMGNGKFTPHFLEFFYLIGDRLLKPKGSLFSFRLFRNDTLMPDQQLYFEKGSLKIRTDKPLDPSYVYHVQIGLVRNWFLVDKDLLEILKGFPTVAWLIARSLGVLLGNVGRIEELSLVGGTKPCKPRTLGEGSLLVDKKAKDIAPWHEWINNDWISCGYVREKDMREAMERTDQLSKHHIDHEYIGPTNVLYADILTFKQGVN